MFKTVSSIIIVCLFLSSCAAVEVTKCAIGQVCRFN